MKDIKLETSVEITKSSLVELLGRVIISKEFKCEVGDILLGENGHKEMCTGFMCYPNGDIDVEYSGDTYWGSEEYNVDQLLDILENKKIKISIE